MPASLPILPDEILESILLSATPQTTTSLAQTSQRFKDVTSSPLLWRSYCAHYFQFWDSRHQIERKFRAPLSAVDWKSLFRERYWVDVQTGRILDDVLGSQCGRIEKVQRIVRFGYDAKDALVRHAGAGEEMEDCLARRYYSRAILGCLHRTIAIPEWDRSRTGEDVPLERVLGAFDMFVLETGSGDLNDMSRSLEAIVARLKDEQPELVQLSPRQKTVGIARFLRDRNLTGIERGKEFYRIEHNFLGIALTDEGHNSLPLTSAAIYCYVARKLGLTADPCGFPFHVHVIIRPDPGYDMDGRPLPEGQQGDPTYMDPFRSIEETPVSELENQLNFLGALTLSQSTFLRASFPGEIALRCGRNIMNSVVQSSHLQDTELDIVNAKYAALWSSMLFAGYADANGMAHPLRRQVGHIPLRRHLPSLMEHFATEFPVDVYLIEQYLIPLFQGLPEYDHLQETVHVMKAGDEIPKQIRRRTMEDMNVKYKIGQVFRHRRYDYMAVITGWDTECGAGDEWMQRMGVDRLRAGRHQSFYHVLVEDKSVRYVAEENIEPIEPDISQMSKVFVKFAGKHFKRWDSTNRRFVSNLRDEYPED